MAKIKIHAGDFENIDGHFFAGMFTLFQKGKIWSSERIQVTDLKSIDIASEESMRKVSGILGWGLAGATLLGQTGLLIGILLGRKEEQVVFVAKFKDGRKLLAEIDQGAYLRIKAAMAQSRVCTEKS